MDYRTLRYSNIDTSSIYRYNTMQRAGATNQDVYAGYPNSSINHMLCLARGIALRQQFSDSNGMEPV